MAGYLPSIKYSLSNQIWISRTGKCFEAETSHIQTVMTNSSKPVSNRQMREIRPK